MSDEEKLTPTNTAYASYYASTNSLQDYIPTTYITDNILNSHYLSFHLVKKHNIKMCFF